MVSWLTRISGSSGNAPGNQSAICWGDQRFSSLASTTRRSLEQAASLAGLGRQGPSRARVWASQARYDERPPLALTSLDTVDEARPSRRAMWRADSPPAMPREISSRSTSDNRASTHSVGTRGRTPPVLAIRSRTALWERPTALAMGRMYSPASYRSQTSACSAAENRTYISHLLIGDSLRCQPRWCVDPLKPPLFRPTSQGQRLCWKVGWPPLNRRHDRGRNICELQLSAAVRRAALSIFGTTFGPIQRLNCSDRVPWCPGQGHCHGRARRTGSGLTQVGKAGSLRYVRPSQ